MPGPTPDVFSDDVEAFREDLNDFESSVRASILKLEVSVQQLGTQVRSLLVWTIVVCVVMLGGLAYSIWWWSSLSAKVDQLGEKFNAVDVRLDRPNTSSDNPPPRSLVEGDDNHRPTTCVLPRSIMASMTN
jgi:hypothetical protein